MFSFWLVLLRWDFSKWWKLRIIASTSTSWLHEVCLILSLDRFVDIVTHINIMWGRKFYYSWCRNYVSSGLLILKMLVALLNSLVLVDVIISSKIGNIYQGSRNGWSLRTWENQIHVSDALSQVLKCKMCIWIGFVR